MITKSEIINKNLQALGRFDVREKHTDHLGNVHFFGYLADASSDLNSLLITHASNVWNSLIEKEKQDILEKIRNGIISDFNLLSFDYATKVECLKFLFRNIINQPASEAIKFIPLMEYIQTQFTKTQLATAFGVSTTFIQSIYDRFSQLKTNLKPLLEGDNLLIKEI